MNENEKLGILEKLRSRREFLKISGRGIAAVTIASSTLSLFGCSPSDDAENVSAYALASGLLIAERNKCTGCKRCEMACTIVNDGKIHPLISRVKISRNFNYGEEMTDNYLNEDGYFGNFLMTPETCFQCEEPKCAEACPVSAIGVAEGTGARVVDEDKCVGCGACTQACPWTMPTVDPETQKSTKCILCGVCADNCITGALKIVPWDKVEAILQGKSYIFA